MLTPCAAPRQRSSRVEQFELTCAWNCGSSFCCTVDLHICRSILNFLLRKAQADMSTAGGQVQSEAHCCGFGGVSVHRTVHWMGWTLCSTKSAMLNCKNQSVVTRLISHQPFLQLPGIHTPSVSSLPHSKVCESN